MLKRIVVWGDSILKGIVLDANTGRYTRLSEEGCVPSVSRSLNIPIINHSKFGMTTEKALSLLEKSKETAEDCDAAVICFGGNDVDHNWPDIAAHPEAPHLPATPLDHFKQNLSDMVKLVQDRGMIPILVSLPPIDPQRYFNWFTKGIEKSENILRWLGEVGYIYRMHELYSDTVVKLSRALDCRLIDIRQAFLEKREFPGCLCLDGIHPNQAGHALMQRVFCDYARENITPSPR